MANIIGIVLGSFCGWFSNNGFVWQWRKIYKRKELVLGRNLELVVFSSSDPFPFILAFVFARTHVVSYRNNILSLFPCKNSRVRKSGRELFCPLMNSISKSKAYKIACHLAKICFDTKFLTPFEEFLLLICNQYEVKKFCKINHLEI